MLGFLFSILRLAAFTVCLFVLRAVSLDYFIINRIFRTHGINYFRNNQRKSKFENYIYFGFKKVIPSWLYLFNLAYTAVALIAVLFMFIGLAFGVIFLIRTALWLFTYMAVIALATNLMYNLIDKKLVRKWCFFGLYGTAIIGIIVTIVLWSIFF